MAYASWSVVFNEQPSASKWNILGTNDAYFDSIIGSGTAWTSWTPTLSGRFTDGDWTKDCKYQQHGKMVFYELSLLATDSTPMGGGVATAIFTLPVTAATIPNTDARQVIGHGLLTDNTSIDIQAIATYGSTTTGVISYIGVSGAFTSQLAIDSTTPFTWTTSDEISIVGFYEAA